MGVERWIIYPPFFQMKTKNQNFPEMTRNERKVLKELLSKAEISNQEIANKINISKQAVFKIKKKLKDSGIITGHSPVINFKKIGINAFALVLINLTSEVWQSNSEEEINQRLNQIPHIISGFRFYESSVSHAIIMGFKDIEQRARYLGKLQTQFANELIINNIFPFSADNIIRDSPLDLFHNNLDGKDYVFNRLFLKRETR